MTRRANILQLFQDHPNEWIPGISFVEAGGGFRYGARIFELREQGWKIEERRDPTGRSVLGEYRLVAQPVQTDLGLDDAA